MVCQVRLYTIKEGKMREWLDGWRTGVVPLRRKFGFRVEGAWVDEAANRFLWILSYDGPEGFEARDRAYYASADREALDPDPAVHVETGEKWFAEPMALDTPSRPEGHRGVSRDRTGSKTST